MGYPAIDSGPYYPVFILVVLLVDVCKTTLVVFQICYFKHSFAFWSKKKPHNSKPHPDWYYLLSCACGLSAPASCLVVCNLNGKSYTMYEPTLLIHLITAKIAQMKISYVLALTCFGVLDGNARSDLLAQIHLVDVPNSLKFNPRHSIISSVLDLMLQN